VPSLGILKILRLQVKSHCLEISDAFSLPEMKKHGRSRIVFIVTDQVKVK
jgi:hypothetical protein